MLASKQSGAPPLRGTRVRRAGSHRLNHAPPGHGFGPWLSVRPQPSDQRADRRPFDRCTTTSSRFVASGPGLLYHAKFRDPKKESTLQRTLGHVRPSSYRSRSKHGSRNTGFAWVRPVLGRRALRDIARRAQCHEVHASDRLDRKRFRRWVESRGSPGSSGSLLISWSSC